MKCTTCQQTDFKTIHGRVFCASCGNDAAKRLKSFETSLHGPGQMDRIGEGNVLDLSAQNKPGQVATNRPNAYPEPGSRIEPTPQASAGPSLGGLAQAAQNTPTATANYQEQTVAQPAANTQVQSSTTVMEPHQTYRVKEPEPEPEQDMPEMPLTPDEAEGFNQDIKPKSKSKLSNLFSGTLWRGATVAMCMVLLAGYITYLNYPNIAVKVAANRAEVDADLPGYVPSGYDFSGPVAYGTGQITIKFQRGEDSNIALSQSDTSWDSKSLLENYVKYQTSTWDTYHENGLTVYTYDNRYATWVNSGMLYKIESSTPLDADEIVKMASSL